MGLKRGYIAAEDTPSADAVRIRRFRLSSGDRVYLPLDVAAFILRDIHLPRSSSLSRRACLVELHGLGPCTS